MTITFQVERNPSPNLCEAVADTAPTNPFYTPQYVGCKRSQARSLWMLLLREENRLVSGCPAFVKNGLFTRSLEIESLPAIPDPGVFCEGLLGACREAHISEVCVHTAASSSTNIPQTPGETSRRKRCEFVIDLQNVDLWRQLRPSHRWRINRSRKAGVKASKTSGLQAWQCHLEAVRASIDRRRGRGERFAEIKNVQWLEGVMESGQGELYQAELGNEVVSSALVVKAKRGAYYFWAGTSATGMAVGASHLLIHEIANQLQTQAVDILNLGGTDLQNKGLIEFKRGFGAREILLEDVDLYLGSRTRRLLGRAFELLKEDRRDFFKRGVERLVGSPARP